MAYTPTEWQKGDVVTSAKLNKLEQGVADAQNGYSVETTETVIVPEQSVTTVIDPEGAPMPMGLLSDVAILPKLGDTVVVTFDGVTYTPPVIVASPYDIYLGELEEEMPSFSNFPFFAVLNVEEGHGFSGTVVTENAGTYAMKVIAETIAVVVSEDFAEAAKIAEASNVFPVTFSYDYDLANNVCDKTFAEIMSAKAAGKKIVAHYIDCSMLCYSISEGNRNMGFVMVRAADGFDIQVTVFTITDNDTVSATVGSISITGAS